MGAAGREVSWRQAQAGPPAAGLEGAAPGPRAGVRGGRAQGHCPSLPRRAIVHFPLGEGGGAGQAWRSPDKAGSPSRRPASANPAPLTVNTAGQAALFTVYTVTTVGSRYRKYRSLG